MLMVAFLLCFVLVGVALAGRQFLPDFNYPRVSDARRQPELLWLYIVSDLATGLAYFASLFMLGHFVHKARHTVRFQGIFIGFGLFMLASGANQLMHIWTLWQSNLWVEGALKVTVAVAAVMTAFALPVLVPKAIALLDTVKVVQERKERLERANVEFQAEIVDRKRAELALRKSEELYRTLVKNFPNGAVMLFDHELHYTVAEGDGLKVIGLSPEMLAGKTIWEVFPTDASLVLEPHFHAALAGTTSTFEMAFSDHVYEVHALPVRNEHGGVAAGMAMMQDVTKRNQEEEALRASEARRQAEQRYHQLAEAIPQIIWTSEPNGWLDYFNQRWYDYTGQSPEQTQASGWGPALHPDDWQPSIDRWNASVETGAIYETEYRFKRASDGAYRWHLSRALPVRDEQGNIVKWFGTFTDIDDQKRAATALEDAQAVLAQRVEERTKELSRANYDLQDQILERKRAEEVIRQSEARLATIFRASPVGICITSFDDGRYLEANPAFESIMGYRRDEVIGRTSKEIGVWVDLDDRTHMFQPIIEHGAASEHEQEFRTKSGVICKTALTMERITIDGQDCLLTFLRDITERKRAEQELRNFAAALERSNGELQNFASIASHDLQEPLRKIIVFGDRVAAKAGDALGADGQDYLARMQSSANRMQTLINDLLTFSRVTTRTQPFVPVDLATVAHDVLSDLEVRIEQVGARIEVGNLPVVDADRTQMRQLLQNLIGNALKFRNPDQSPVVKVSGALLNDDGTGDGSQHSLGTQMVQITVEDNGIGFDEKYLDRIFAIFQRLHGRATYEGSGVGLAVCRKIVERHGGTITADSAPGRGARFVVTLPMRQPNHKG